MDDSILHNSEIRSFLISNILKEYFDDKGFLDDQKLENSVITIDLDKAYNLTYQEKDEIVKDIINISNKTYGRHIDFYAVNFDSYMIEKILYYIENDKYEKINIEKNRKDENIDSIFYRPKISFKGKEAEKFFNQVFNELNSLSPLSKNIVKKYESNDGELTISDFENTLLYIRNMRKESRISVTLDDYKIISKLFSEEKKFAILFRNEEEYKIAKRIAKKSDAILLATGRDILEMKKEGVNFSPDVKICLYAYKAKDIPQTMLNEIVLTKGIKIDGVYIPNNIGEINRENKYNITDFRHLRNLLKIITDSIRESERGYIRPRNAEEKEEADFRKFMKCYQLLGKIISYDTNAFDENGKILYKKSKDKIRAHNIIGGLTKNLAVCEGYAKILDQVLKSLGIKSMCVTGFNHLDSFLESGTGHEWNQVKIGDNWYNIDLTWDEKNIKLHNNLKYCLLSDENFANDHHTDMLQTSKCSTTNFDKERISSSLYYYPNEKKEKANETDDILKHINNVKENHNNNGDLIVQIKYDKRYKMYYMKIARPINDDDAFAKNILSNSEELNSHEYNDADLFIPTMKKKIAKNNEIYWKNNVKYYISDINEFWNKIIRDDVNLPKVRIVNERKKQETRRDKAIINGSDCEILLKNGVNFAFDKKVLKKLREDKIDTYSVLKGKRNIIFRIGNNIYSNIIYLLKHNQFTLRSKASNLLMQGEEYLETKDEFIEKDSTKEEQREFRNSIFEQRIEEQLEEYRSMCNERRVLKKVPEYEPIVNERKVKYGRTEIFNTNHVGYENNVNKYNNVDNGTERHNKTDDFDGFEK